MEKELKNVEYVIVTMCLKDDRAHKIKGLFLGYKPLVESHTQLVSNDEYFVWLYKDKNVYMLNVDHYDIHITTKPKIDHVMLHYSADAQLKLIYEFFIKNGKTLTTGLIDINTYNITEELQKEIDEGNKKANVSSPLYNNNTTRDNNRSSAVNYSHVYKKKEVSTSIIKRSTKYPISVAIEKMKIKVEEIRGGKYKSPALLPIPADKEKEEDVKKSKGVTKDDDLYEDYYANCGYNRYGMMR